MIFKVLSFGEDLGEAPPATIFLQLKSYSTIIILTAMKTMHLHRFWLDVLKRSKLHFVINWFNR